MKARPRLGMRRRLHHRFRHSLGFKLVALFLVLAFLLGATFLAGMRMAFTNSWRETGRPLVADYADRLVADIGSPPDVARAQALAERLHLRIRIDGPQLHWSSEGGAGLAGTLPQGPDWLRADPDFEADAFESGAWAKSSSHWRDGWLLMRRSADGHELRFGMERRPWREEPRLIGWVTLAALLGLIALAYGLVRHMLRPLQDIHAGAQRFGSGDFSQPIPVRRSDELGHVAAQVNTMARSIQQMLEAKRGLLLAISHELRSPLTRARLNAELAAPPATDADAQQAHAALLNDLGQMRELISELLETERLSTGHAALHAEPVEVAALVRAVVAERAEQEEQGPAKGRPPVRLDLPAQPVMAQLDRVRLQLALRNLLDNAQRHSLGAAEGPSVALTVEEVGGAGEGAQRWLCVSVRDHGPGVPDDQLAQLSQPFYRADAARQRTTGGVGLGLYLCRLVAQAHGGELRLRNAAPGLLAELWLPWREPRVQMP